MSDDRQNEALCVLLESVAMLLIEKSISDVRWYSKETYYNQADACRDQITKLKADEH